MCTIRIILTTLYTTEDTKVDNLSRLVICLNTHTQHKAEEQTTVLVSEGAGKQGTDSHGRERDGADARHRRYMLASITVALQLYCDGNGSTGELILILL